MRKTLPPLVMALGLLAGFIAGKTFASDAASSGTDSQTGYSESQVGYVEVAGTSTTAPNPFVQENSAAPAKGTSQFGLKQVAGPAADGDVSPASGDCCQSGCCNGCCSGNCDDCPNIGTMFFAGLESFRSIVDGDFQNNNGSVVGLNVGVPLPWLRDYGIGSQLGGSYGIYDLDGRSDVGLRSVPNDVQQQIFMTSGLFHRATECCPLNVGIGYDWMVNDAYGFLATSPRLGQWRGQIGYALNDCNEIGVWSTLHDRGATKAVAGFNFLPTPTIVTYDPIDQFNFFFRHDFGCGMEGTAWIGFPTGHNSDVNGGRLGEFTTGLQAEVPLTDRLAMYAKASYMKPTASPSGAAGIEDAYSIGFGLTFYPGGVARNRTTGCNTWMPYLPVADNSSFLVNTNTEF